MDKNTYQIRPFTKFGRDWGILTAGIKGDFNSMTIGWGGLGTIWGRPVAFLFVKPVRYTFDFIERHDEITVSFYDDKYRRVLGAIFGGISGRDADKAAEAGFTPEYLEDGVTYKEASETLVMHKIYMQQMDKSGFPQAARPFYQSDREHSAHYMIIAELDRIITK